MTNAVYAMIETYFPGRHALPGARRNQRGLRPAIAILASADRVSGIDDLQPVPFLEVDCDAKDGANWAMTEQAPACKTKPPKADPQPEVF